MLPILEKRQILSAGAIGINRFRNSLQLWWDNKEVYLTSNFVGVGITVKVQGYGNWQIYSRVAV